MHDFWLTREEISHMPLIHLTTFIAAPADRVYDLSRSVSLHRRSMQLHQETVLAGPASGLLSLHEEITWQARHLGKTRTLTVKITEAKAPLHFTDEMVKGDFRLMHHEHHFKAIENGTLMIDLFRFESPYGVVGRLFNRIYLTAYMRRLLEQRNQTIKTCAETDGWKQVLA